MTFWQRFARKKPQTTDPFLAPARVKVTAGTLANYLVTCNPDDVARAIIVQVSLGSMTVEQGERFFVHLTAHPYMPGRALKEESWQSFLDTSSEADYVGEQDRTLVGNTLTVTYEYVRKVDATI